MRLGRFMQRDPLGYPDGMNGYAAYHVLGGNLDPSGLDSGFYGDSAHVGLVVDVLDEDGNVVGHLKADFGLYGWTVGNSSSNSSNRGGSCWKYPGQFYNLARGFNGRSQIQVEYVPGVEGRPSRVASGDNQALIDFIISSAGIPQSELNNKIQNGERGFWDRRGTGDWLMYRAGSNNCSDYTIAGIRVLTGETRYLGSFTPSGLFREWDKLNPRFTLPHGYRPRRHLNRHGHHGFYEYNIIRETRCEWHR